MTTKIPNKPQPVQPDPYAGFFKEVKTEIEEGQYDRLNNLFELIQKSNGKLLQNHSDTCTKLVYEIVLPKMEDPQFREKFQKTFPKESLMKKKSFTEH